MALGTIAEASRLLGYSTVNTLSYAVKTGKIKCLSVGGRRMIELDGLPERWEAIRDAKGCRQSARLQAPGSLPSPAPAMPSMPEEAPPGPDGVVGLEASRKAKQHFDAELARLKFEEQAHRLVRADEVERVVFGALRQLRDRVTGIAPRVQAAMCAAVGPLTIEQEVAVRQLLENELREALVTVAGIKFTVDGPTADVEDQEAAA